jgi:Bacterial protein of unknown function (DUF885)
MYTNAGRCAFETACIAGRKTTGTGDGGPIAVEPGQLMSYEVGGLEILSLREEARSRLAAKFDLREFHQRVLEQGAIPLGALREHVMAWIEKVKTSANALAGPGQPEWSRNFGSFALIWKSSPSR